MTDRRSSTLSCCLLVYLCSASCADWFDTYLPTSYCTSPLYHHCHYHYHDALLILTDWTYLLIILTSLLRILFLHTPHHASTAWVMATHLYIYILHLTHLHLPSCFTRTCIPVTTFPFIRVAYFTTFILAYTLCLPP